MKAVPEEASERGFDPVANSLSEDYLDMVKQQQQLPPEPHSKSASSTRSVFGNMSLGSLDRSNSKRGLLTTTTTTSSPGSPRSTLDHETNDACEDPEDGVILTGKTRSGMMTRRHSMSRLFCITMTNSSENVDATSTTTSSTTSTTSEAIITLEQVAQMPPGLKRRESLRRVLQQSRAQSEDTLDYGTVHTVQQPQQQPRPTKRHQMRRNSLGAIGRLASSPALGAKQRSGGRGGFILQRTISYGKQDSLRAAGGASGGGDWNSNSSNKKEHANSQRSLTGSTSTTHHRGGLKRQSSLAELMVDCNTTVSVSNTWASIRRIDNYQQRLGEQIIFKMMELDPLGARMNMRLESFFSPRFAQICRVLYETIDMVVTLLGPDMDEAGPELAACGAACRAEGIVTDRLGDAVSSAVDTLLGPEEVTPDMIKAWKIVFDSLRRRLQAPVASTTN